MIAVARFISLGILLGFLNPVTTVFSRDSSSRTKYGMPDCRRRPEQLSPVDGDRVAA